MSSNSCLPIGEVAGSCPMGENSPSNVIVEANPETAVSTVIHEVPINPGVNVNTDHPVNLENIVSVSQTPSGPLPSEIVEGIVIPPDPERGNAIPDSFESMCIDAELDVQMDLVSVIRSMILFRWITVCMTIVFAITALCFVFLQNMDISLFSFVMALVNAFGFFSSYKYSRGLMLSFIVLLVSILPPLIYFAYDTIIRILDKKALDVIEMIIVIVYIVICIYQCLCALTIRRLLYYIPASQRDLIRFMERENCKEIKPKLVISHY